MYIVECCDAQGWFTVARCRWRADARYLAARFREYYQGVMVSRV
jgi:hypothetical protein